MSGRLVYWNGDFVPENEARVSIYDSALMFGDTVYERNGGENTPNGLGLWHSKDMLNKYNLTLGDLEEYKIDLKIYVNSS